MGVVFRISEEIQQLTLDPNARRQVYLIYKEAVYNTVRHAQATAVDISMSVVGGELVMKIGDNGRGWQIWRKATACLECEGAPCLWEAGL
jgi:signal transduction histidine kinase